MENNIQTYSTHEQIACPYCGEIQHYEVCDGELSSVITYWGEDGPQEFECNYCEGKFFINELVTRDFEVAKKERDFN